MSHLRFIPSTVLVTAVVTKVVLAVVLIVLAITLPKSHASKYDIETYIPINAYTYMPMVIEAQEQIHPEFEQPWYLLSLIEHESCIWLKHKRCWKPTSELNTKRELGRGLLQLTKAFRKDGSVRFDTLTELRHKHIEHLRDLRWDNIKRRPDLQSKAVILLIRDIERRIPGKVVDKRAMVDAAYNGGVGGLHKDRRLCGIRKGCDPNYWFGHVELSCAKSKRILYGNRNACDINRNHVHEVLNVRLLKYGGWYDLFKNPQGTSNIFL